MKASFWWTVTMISKNQTADLIGIPMLRDEVSGIYNVPIEVVL
jgi:hypothetical protein